MRRLNKSEIFAYAHNHAKCYAYATYAERFAKALRRAYAEKLVWGFNC